MEKEIPRNPGARVIDQANVFFATGSAYLVWHLATQSNLYQISIPQ